MSTNNPPAQITDSKQLVMAKRTNHPVGLFFHKLPDTGLKILRDSACGSLVSIASLIVTIFLTVYIFNYPRSQETAKLEISMTMSQIGTDTWVVFF